MDRKSGPHRFDRDLKSIDIGSSGSSSLEQDPGLEQPDDLARRYPFAQLARELVLVRSTVIRGANTIEKCPDVASSTRGPRSEACCRSCSPSGCRDVRVAGATQREPCLARRRRPRPWVESTDGQKSQGLTHAAMTRMRYDWAIVGDVAQTAKLEYETGRKSLSSRPASVSARCDASSLPASVNASHPFTAPCRIF